MKLYDCFIYNNEDLILDIRFNILNQYVEKFVLVESNVDHQGNKKKLNFDKKKFKEFENKIEYLVVDNFPNDFSRTYTGPIVTYKKTTNRSRNNRWIKTTRI